MLALFLAAIAAPPIHVPDATGGAASACVAARHAVAAGAVAQDGDFAVAPCSADREHAFRYDASAGASRTRRAIAAGEVLAAFPEFGVDRVLPGDRLTLVVAAGPVTVSREVEAVQAARGGQRLFVRTAEGELFSVRYAGRPQ